MTISRGITHQSKLDDDWLHEHLYARDSYDLAQEDWERENPDKDPSEAPEFTHSHIYFGDWHRFDDGVLIPNKDGKHGFSATYSNTSGRIAVLHSKWYQNGRFVTSFLFPDEKFVSLLTKEHGGEEGYSLPAEAFKESAFNDWGGEIGEITVFAMEDRPMITIIYDAYIGTSIPDGFVNKTVDEILERYRSGKEFGRLEYSNALLIHAMRLAVKHGRITHDEVRFEFKERGEPCHVLYPDRNGNLAHWPKGFCDHMDKILEGLIDW